MKNLDAVHKVLSSDGEIIVAIPESNASVEEVKTMADSYAIRETLENAILPISINGFVYANKQKINQIKEYYENFCKKCQFLGENISFISL